MSKQKCRGHGRDDVTFVSNSVTCYSGFKVGMNSDPWFYLQSHHSIAVTVSWCCRKLGNLWKYKKASEPLTTVQVSVTAAL